MKAVIRSLNAPAAIGPYSQAVRAGGMIFLSGQIPIDPATGALISEKDVYSQTRRVLANLQAVLAAAGVSRAEVVRTTVYLKDMNDFAEMNRAYAEVFGGSSAPARSTVEVARLPKDACVEIDAIAMVG